MQTDMNRAAWGGDQTKHRVRPRRRVHMRSSVLVREWIGAQLKLDGFAGCALSALDVPWSARRIG